MIACTASLLLLLAPQDTPRADLSHHGAAFFPLRAGAEWSYDVTRDGGESQTLRRSVERRVAVPGGSAWRITTGNARRAEYWAVRPDGVWRFAGSNRGLTHVDPDGTPQRVLPCPPGAVTECTWNVDAADGTSSTHRVQILAFDELVAVPAGEFHTVCAQHSYEEPGGRVVETTWYARGIGPVQIRIVRVSADAGQETWMRLRSTTVRAPRPVSDRAPLVRSLQGAEESSIVPLTSPLLDELFPNRWFRVDANGRNRIAVVLQDPEQGERAVWCDAADSPELWAALLRAEGHDLVLDFEDREGLQVSPLLCAIATVAETLRSGAYTVDASGGEYRYRATAEAGSWCAELRTIGSDPRRPGTVTVEFRAGVPTRVQIEP